MPLPPGMPASPDSNELDDELVPYLYAHVLAMSPLVKRDWFSCIVDTSTGNSMITTTMLRQYYPNIQRYRCPPVAFRYAQAGTCIYQATQFVRIPLLLRDEGAKTMEFVVTAYVIEMEEEMITLGVTFLRKNQLDIRWMSDKCPFDHLECGKKKFSLSMAWPLPSASWPGA